MGNFVNAWCSKHQSARDHSLPIQPTIELYREFRNTHHTKADAFLRMRWLSQFFYLDWGAPNRFWAKRDGRHRLSGCRSQVLEDWENPLRCGAAEWVFFDSCSRNDWGQWPLVLDRVEKARVLYSLRIGSSRVATSSLARVYKSEIDSLDFLETSYSLADDIWFFWRARRHRRILWVHLLFWLLVARSVPKLLLRGEYGEGSLLGARVQEFSEEENWSSKRLKLWFTIKFYRASKDEKLLDLKRTNQASETDSLLLQSLVGSNLLFPKTQVV